MSQSRNFLLLDDQPASAEGFVGYAEALGLKPFAARDQHQFGLLAERLAPIMIALNCDTDDLDPIAALEAVALLGLKPQILVYGREHRLLQLGRQAARLMRLPLPEMLLAPVDFRELARTARTAGARAA